LKARTSLICSFETGIVGNLGQSAATVANIVD